MPKFFLPALLASICIGGFAAILTDIELPEGSGVSSAPGDSLFPHGLRPSAAKSCGVCHEQREFRSFTF